MRRVIVFLAFFSASGGIVSACEIRVRDAAFRTPRDVHRLCVIAEADDPEAAEIEERLQTWLRGPAAGLNVRIERVDAHDPETDWNTLGIPSAPPQLPVTVLVGHSNSSGENFVISHWEPAPDDGELERLKSSPLREQLTQKLGRHLAVLLYFGADGDSETRAMLRKRATGNVGSERLGLGLIELDPADLDDPLLMSFAGIDPQAGNALFVAFGQGKLMEPPLFGEQITRDEVDNLIEQLCAACSCSKPLPMLGVDLPLVWTPELDSTLVLMDAELEGEFGLASTEEDTETPASEDSSSDDLLIADRSPAETTTLLGPVLWTLTALVVIVGGASVLVLRGSRG